MNGQRDTATWQSYFSKGERLLWEGAPRRKIARPFLQTFLSIFGIPFLFAGLFIWSQALNTILQGSWMALLGVALIAFGLPFVGAGLAMAFGTWWASMTEHKRVRYALSTRNAYIAKRLFKRTLEVYPIMPKAELTLAEDKTGGGSVTFLSREVQDSDGTSTKTAGFDNIDNVRDVYNLIRNIQAGAYA